LRAYKSTLDGENKLRIADNKYVSQIYFHTLFLYAILRQRNYTFSLGSSDSETEKTIDEVLQDLFKTRYGGVFIEIRRDGRVDDGDRVRKYRKLCNYGILTKK